MKYFILLVTIILIRHVRGYFTSNVERPKIKESVKQGNIELRTMESHIVAKVRMSGSVTDAPGRGFGMLAGYIFGDNTDQGKIDMTAPVTSTPDSQKIAMTAPVTSQGEGESTIVSFIMPSKWTVDSLPKPNNTNVVLEEVAEKHLAVRSFSGYATAGNVSTQWFNFQKELEKNEIERDGSFTLAQYNDPRTPPWMRENELWVELTKDLNTNKIE